MDHGNPWERIVPPSLSAHRRVIADSGSPLIGTAAQDDMGCSLSAPPLVAETGMGKRKARLRLRVPFVLQGLGGKTPGGSKHARIMT